MALAFSSSDQDAINRKLDVEKLPHEVIDKADVEDFFEIERSVAWIKSNNFKKVALQFPDAYLQNSSDVALIFQQNVQCQIFILADTYYGSCCVDEIAAQHASVDAIIHYGEACLSPTNRLPVMYIFGQRTLDTDNAVEEFKKIVKESDTNIIVFYELVYSHAIGSLAQKLREFFTGVIFSQYQIPGENKHVSSNNDEVTEIHKCGRIIQLPKSHSLSNYNIFHIGANSRTLSNLMLNFKECKFSSYNPETKTSQIETLDVNKFLRKRYYYIEKAKDAKIVGILVGTLGVCKYLQILNHLRTLIAKAGKKSYTIVVGKLNDAKLSNFSEIEIFVYVACPESSVIDSHDYFQPIVTPFEMEIACNQARSWTGDYVTDFSSLLPGASMYVPIQINQEAQSDMSLVTGQMRTLGSLDENQPTNVPGTDVAVRDKMTIVSIHSNAAGEVLSSRSWRGLEQRLGETDVAEILPGKTGIASGYDNEGTEAV